MPLQLSLTEDIAAPPARVYAGLIDLDAAREWMPGFIGIENLTPGPVAVGTAWKETRKVFGMTATEHFEVRALEPEKLVELYIDGTKGSSRSGWYRFRWELAPSGAGTKLALNGEIGGNEGFFARLMGKLMIGSFRKALAKDMAALKAHLEKTG